MSDLVKRLRFGSTTHMGASRMNLEAADEIERLREALKDLLFEVDCTFGESKSRLMFQVCERARKALGELLE